MLEGAFMGSNNEVLRQVQNYRKIVLIYEGLQSQINELLKRYGGSSQNMTDEDRENYRLLAKKRDEVMNEMRVLEQMLLQEEELE